MPTIAIYTVIFNSYITLLYLFIYINLSITYQSRHLSRRYSDSSESPYVLWVNKERSPSLDSPALQKHLSSVLQVGAS